MELHHTENDKTIAHERTSRIPLFLPTGHVENYSLQCRIKKLTICHAVSIWYNRVQKMHQRELDFDVNLSVDDVTTLAHDVAPDLA